MDDSGDERKRPRGSNSKGLNYFGLFLLFSSSAFLIAPGLFGPLFLNLSADVSEAVIYYYFWTFVSYFIFAFSIILLMVNNVFRFFENQRADRSPSQPIRNWLINLKIFAISLLLWFALVLIL